MHRYIWSIVAVLALATASPAAATFPGNNGALVFSGIDAASHTVQLYRMAPSGGSPTQLTPAQLTPVNNECPSWSADGGLIYFDSLDRSTGDAAHIFRIDPAGGSRTLADSRTGPTHLCPTVNRTGTRIAAIEYAADNTERIVSMNTDGSARQGVGPTAAPNQDNYAPRFAPTGSRILFNQVTYEPFGGQQLIGRSDLLIANSQGKATNITGTSDDQFFSPSWSPGGNTILAVRGSFQDQIVQMSAGGSNVRQLFKAPTGVSLASPTFSPDRKRIAFTQCRGDCGDPELKGAGSIWVMNADGSNPTQIFTSDGASLQPDGKLDWGVSSTGRTACGTAVGCWRFDERRGARAVDSSPNSNHGRLLRGAARRRGGVFKKGLRLDGVNDLVRVRDHRSLDVGDSFALEGWIRRSRSSRRVTMFNKGGRGFKLTVMGTRGRHRVWLTKANGARIARSRRGVPADRRFHQIVATKDGRGTARIYIDGRKAGTVQLGRGVVSNTRFPLVIGSRRSPRVVFDEFVVYDRALTPGEVARHYRAGR